VAGETPATGGVAAVGISPTPTWETKISFLERFSGIYYLIIIVFDEVFKEWETCSVINNFRGRINSAHTLNFPKDYIT
jgi:hypothetical protein